MSYFPLLVRYNNTQSVAVVEHSGQIQSGQSFNVLATNFDPNKLVIVLQSIIDDCARTAGLGMSRADVSDIEKRCRKVLNPDVF